MRADVPPDVEPMTLTLLGRFFGVPLLIIGVVVAGAVVVVLLFGGPALPQKRTVESLIQSLESNSGDRSAGLLLPREKELWQTALELSERLRNKTAELTDAEIDTVAARLAAIIDADLAVVDKAAKPRDQGGGQQGYHRQRRMEFVLRALARTERDQALGKLVEVVRAGPPTLAIVAMQELANLREFPRAREGVAPIVGLLERGGSTESALVACTALSVLAYPGDPVVIAALERARLTGDGEIAWSAALAEARLGSPAGKTTLLDMLDRAYWEGGERYEVRDAGGQVHRYRMPGVRIDGLLIAAIQAAAAIEDLEVRASVERLLADRSPRVAAAARERTGSSGRGDLPGAPNQERVD